jgi:O-antigen ligase
VAALAAAPFDAVRALAPAHRSAEGGIVLVLLLAAAAGGALLQAWSCRAEASGSTRTGLLGLRGGARAAVVVVAVLLAAAPYVAALAGERGTASRQAAFGATNSRLTDAGSTRYRYWKVAVDTAADHPLKGAGAGSFGTIWLRARPIDERVRNAHSLWLETLAELGVVGLALLLTLAGAVLAGARSALRRDAALAAGPAAALLVWTVHAGLDWLWQMPAVTLPALALAALLLAAPAAVPAATPR